MFEDLAICRADELAVPLASRSLRGMGLRYPLGLNEAQSPPPDGVLRAMEEASRFANYYPDPTSRELRIGLGERLALAADRIVIGAGSEELIFTLALIAGDPGRSIVHCDPCFPSYRRAVALTGASPRRVRIREDGAENIDGVLEAIDGSTSMVVVTTPSNPAGVMLAADDLERLVDGVPAGTLLVVDEAYHEYAIQAGGPDALAILRRHEDRHWVILRTFSKAYGLAGVRVGYALASSQAVAGALLKAAPTFNVSRVAQAAAVACLEEEAAMWRAVERTGEERERLKRWCARHDLPAFDSVTNFVSLELPIDAVSAAAVLHQRGIASSPWRHPEFAGVLRIGIGCANATRATIEALALCSTNDREVLTSTLAVPEANGPVELPMPVEDARATLSEVAAGAGADAAAARPWAETPRQAAEMEP